MVPTCKKDFSWELLGCPLLSVKFAILPIKTWHRNKIDLVNFVIRVLKERVHFKSLYKWSVDAENINDGLLLVGGKDVPSIVKYRTYL